MSSAKEEKINELNNDFRNELMRIAVNLYYDYQDIRIKSLNRIRDIVRKKNEGFAFNEREEKKTEKTFDKKYTDDKLDSIMDQLRLEDQISERDYQYFHNCQELLTGPEIVKMFECKHCSRKNKQTLNVGGVVDLEKEAFKIIRSLVRIEPAWKEFLSKIKGIGEIIAGTLIKEFGYCERFETTSRLWAFTGNHTVGGLAPKREKGKKLGFSLRLKTFTWKISDSLMKSNKGYYRQLYDTEKEKQLNKTHEVGYLSKTYNGYEETSIHLSKGHAHNRALRKVRKHFLSHYWECSRELVGLSTKKTYVEGVLGHENIMHWRDVLELEG